MKEIGISFKAICQINLDSTLKLWKYATYCSREWNTIADVF